MSRLNKKELAMKSIEFILRKPTSQRILCLNFAVTYLCNSLCSMCSIWQRYKKNPDLVREELTYEQIENLLGSKYLENLQIISFTGGEPFLRKDFVDIAGLFIKKFPKAIFSIATNGLKPDLITSKVKEIQDRFNPRHLSISLSMDGLFGKHDEIRGVPGAYRLLNKTIELLKSGTDTNIGIDFTITPWNYEELCNVYRYTKENQIKFLTSFAHYSDFYYENRGTEFNWTRATLDKIGSHLEKIVNDMVKNESFIDRLIDPGAFFMSGCAGYQERNRKHHKCHSGTHSMFLDPYGNVYPCIILDHRIGNVKNGSFNREWTSTGTDIMRSRISSGECRCWVACESVLSELRHFDVVKWNVRNKLIRGV